MGFKTLFNVSGFLIFKLGLTNKPKLFFDKSTLFLKIKKFQRIFIKGLFYEILMFFLSQIRFFKIPDSYRGKGFFYKGQYLKLKRGKRKR